MAINPVSDLVMDVTHAADPAAYQTAVNRLQMLGAGAVYAGSGTAATRLTRDSFPAMVSEAAYSSAPTDNQNNSYKKFEAFVLQSFVQSMFTSDGSTVFGKGIAGEYWKSMLSEALANKMADGGGVGIATMLAKTGQAHSGEREAIANGSFENNAAPIAQGIVHGMERKLIQHQIDKIDFSSI